MFPIEEKYKQLTTETKVIILVFILGLFAAWMFRYSAPVHVTSVIVSVTDRWTGCVVYHRFQGAGSEGYKSKKSCP